MLRVALVLLLASGIQAAIDEKAVKDILDEYAALEHKLWNMSLAVAFYSPTLLPGGPLVASAAGYTNAGLLVKAEGAPRAAQPDDLYVWGSITKIFTGPAVLQLVDKVGRFQV
jgi:CubicO group peptidase (beta-lactamase class C family)